MLHGFTVTILKFDKYSKLWYADTGKMRDIMSKFYVQCTLSVLHESSVGDMINIATEHVYRCRLLASLSLMPLRCRSFHLRLLARWPLSPNTFFTITYTYVHPLAAQFHVHLSCFNKRHYYLTLCQQKLSTQHGTLSTVCPAFKGLFPAYSLPLWTLNFDLKSKVCISVPKCIMVVSLVKIRLVIFKISS